MASETSRRVEWYGRIGRALAAAGIGSLLVGIGQVFDVVAPSSVPLLLVGGVLIVIGVGLMDAGESEDEDLTQWDG